MLDPTRARTAPAILVQGAHQNNLKGVTVRVPVGAVTAVTGVAGAGKSSLADYMRSLWARAATLHCRGCGEPVERYSASSIFDALVRAAAGAQALICFPVRVGRARRAVLHDVLEQAGFRRVLEDGAVKPIDPLLPVQGAARRALRLRGARQSHPRQPLPGLRSAHRRHRDGRNDRCRRRGARLIAESDQLRINLHHPANVGGARLG